MSVILYYGTIVLNVVGALFAVIYLWINLFCSFADVAVRSESLLKTARTSMWTSLVISLLASLLSDRRTFDEALIRSANLYTIIAITWVVMLLICSLMLLVSSVSRRWFKPGVPGIIKRIYGIAWPGAILGVILAWLLA